MPLGTYDPDDHSALHYFDGLESRDRPMILKHREALVKTVKQLQQQIQLGAGRVEPDSESIKKQV